MKFITVIIFVVFMAGCSSSLSTLIDISNEQKEQNRYIAQQKVLFQRLSDDIKHNKLVVGKTTREYVLRHYSEPITTQIVPSGEQLLFREPCDYFPKQKIYLDFDAKGILQKIDVRTQ